MNIDEIKQQLQKLTISYLGPSVDPKDYADDHSALQTILSDSLQAITFVCLIENEFDIEFEDDEIDLDFFVSCDHIAKLIHSRLTARNKALISQPIRVR